MKKFLTFLAAVFILAACSTQPTTPVAPANAEAAPVHGVSASLIDIGIYELLGKVEDIAAPQTAAGKVGEHEGLKLLQATQSLSATKGVSFGYRFKLVSERNGPMHGFEMLVEHPPMRGVDGKVHKSQLAPLDLEFENGRLEHDIVYILAEDFEVLPGTWKLSILLHGVPVISRTFELK